jgi:hypothetical protein
MFIVFIMVTPERLRLTQERVVDARRLIGCDPLKLLQLLLPLNLTKPGG